MLEGFKREPEEDDGVEEAIQTMGPEDLQKKGKKDGGEGGERKRRGVGGWRRQEVPRRERERGRHKKGKKSMRKGCGELQPTK